MKDKLIRVDPFYHNLIKKRSKTNLRPIKSELELILKKEFGDKDE